MVKHYHELIAWQLAEQFKQRVLNLVKLSPSAERDFRYRSQLTEAASSVSKNIAEGFKRFSPGVMEQFLDYAIASLHEAEDRLRDGIELGHFRAEECVAALQDAKRCGVASIRLKHSQRRIKPRPAHVDPDDYPPPSSSPAVTRRHRSTRRHPS